MKKLIAIFAIGCWVTLFAHAQTGAISGKIIDAESNESVAEATIRILQAKDSMLVAGKASDKNGAFSIPVKIGDYIVHISFIGYTDFFKSIRLSASSPNINIGTIKLSTDNVLLDEAVVSAKAVEIRVKGDTIEYNADSYKVTQSAVLEDLLKKMPGVEISSEGKITINGKEIKKILVDGKEFFSSDPKVASKNLPAKVVEKLQVLDRRTDMAQMTGFDDGDEETVLNLEFKPGMKQGVFGNAFAGYGSKNRYEANAMVNYMRENDQLTFIGGANNTNNAGFSDLASSMFGNSGGGRRRRGGFGNTNGISDAANTGLNFSKEFSKKLTLGGNVRYGYTDNVTTSKEFTENILKSGNTFEKENNASNNISQNLNSEFRLEWQPDSLTKIIFNPELSIYKNIRNEQGDFLTYNTDKDSINYGNSDYYAHGNGNDVELDLDVSRQLGKKGRVLSGSFDYEFGNSENKGDNVSNTYYLGTRPNDIIDQRFVNTNNYNRIRTFLSYVEPLGSNNFLQLAYTFRNNRSASDKDTRSQDADGNYTVLDKAYSKSLENNFTHHEVELNFRSQREKYNYLLGFSVQPSDSHSKTFIGDSIIDNRPQRVVNYAPMARFDYQWSKQRNLRLYYDGRTNQPSVAQLSPVVDISDPLNITYGNPDLKPSFDHRFRVRYRDFDPKKSSAVLFFGGFNYTLNDIVSDTKTDVATGRKEATYTNASGSWNANGRFILNQPLKNIKFSFFSMSYGRYAEGSAFVNNEKNLSKTTNLSEVLGLNYRSDAFDFSIRGRASYSTIKNSLQASQNQEYFNYGASANTTVYLPYDFSIESDINYLTNSGYSAGFEQDEVLWNASISKQFLKQKNATLRFKIYDILQDRSNISRSVTSNYIRDTTTNTLTSYFMFHFVYRFNIFKGGITQEEMMESERNRHRRRYHR